MKTSILIFILAIKVQLAFAQPKLIVNKHWVTSAYLGFSTDVYQINKVPGPIVDSANSILTKYMGNISKRLTFSMAQVIDTSKYLRYERKRAVPADLPKYEMIYDLEIPDIGIKHLTIELRLTPNGTPLKLTWPRKAAKDVSVFFPTETVRTLALKKAQELKFPTDNYKVDFFYDEAIQKFFWQFDFPNGEAHRDGGGNYHRVSINWLDPKEIRIEEIRTSVEY